MLTSYSGKRGNVFPVWCDGSAGILFVLTRTEPRRPRGSPNGKEASSPEVLNP
jgi:hypothetical protein